MAYKHATVAELLGVRPKVAETSLALAYSVQKGLPVSALDRFAGRVSPQDVRGFSYRVVPKPTLERRRKEKQPLTTDESDRLAPFERYPIGKYFVAPTAFSASARELTIGTITPYAPASRTYWM